MRFNHGTDGKKLKHCGQSFHSSNTVVVDFAVETFYTYSTMYGTGKIG